MKKFEQYEVVLHENAGQNKVRNTGIDFKIVLLEYQKIPQYNIRSYLFSKMHNIPFESVLTF